MFVWGFAHWRSIQVPNRIFESSFLKNDPVQTATAEKPFSKTVNNLSYVIEPVFEYELWGLVVSDHDSSSWYDISHESWGDYLNTKDICVIWGTNLANPGLSKLSFSSGNFTCYVSTRDGEAWQKFNSEQISNNHVIPATLEIKRAIASSHIGDVIHFKGQLVNYNINGGPQRKSSVVRTDREDKACEIVYVKEFSTITRYNRFWTQLARFSKLLAILCLIGIVVLQVRFHMRYKE